MIEKPNPDMIVGWHVADCIVNVSGQLEGEFTDWPTHMQDKVLDAMEKLNIATGRSYEMIRAICEYDVDTKWYVVLTVRAPKRLSEVHTIQ
jgi:hypothetical protein